MIKLLPQYNGITWRTLPTEALVIDHYIYVSLVPSFFWVGFTFIWGYGDWSIRVQPLPMIGINYRTVHSHIFDMRKYNPEDDAPIVETYGEQVE